MSEEEFDSWATDEVRAEFVDGEVIEMSPVLTRHVLIHNLLLRLLGNYLEVTGQGLILGPELTARLRPGLRRVPDLIYLDTDHLDRLKEGYLEGPADAMFEIVSRESVERDWRQKFAEYEAAGVREYWVIDPANRHARLYVLADGAFAVAPMNNGWVESVVIPGFKLRWEWLWADPLPSVRQCLRDLNIAY